MNSTTESAGTPSHLSTVKQLLAELDLMKNKGIGARDRLDFILEHGVGLMEEFDLQDAFDVEARARSNRLRQLDDLRSSMTNTEQLWSGGPLLEDVKEAASNLFGHLHRFLKDALSRERKSEIDMLSQLWEWAPDMRWLYPWLTGEGPIYMPKFAEPGIGVARHSSEYPTAPEPEAPNDDAKEFAMQKEKLYAEMAPAAGGPGWSVPKTQVELPSEEQQLKEMEKLWPKVPAELERKLELEHNTELERLNKSVLESPSSDETVVKKEKFDSNRKIRFSRKDLDQPSRWQGKVIHQEDPSAQGRVVATMRNPVVEPEPVDHIVQDAWTTALRELTLDDWQFTKVMPWRSDSVKGKVLLWHLQTGEARVEVYKTGRVTNVSLRILKDGRLWKHEAELNDDEVEELHLDPISFVKKALDD